jgi:hypothetical protein
MIRITGALSVRSSHGWSVSCVVPVPVLCWPTRPDWGRCWARPVQGVEGSIRSGDPILLRELTFGRASGWCGLGAPRVRRATPPSIRTLLNMSPTG